MNRIHVELPKTKKQTNCQKISRVGFKSEAIVCSIVCVCMCVYVCVLGKLRASKMSKPA